MATDTRALATVAPSELDAQTAELASRIQVRFPQDCTPAQAREVALLAMQYDLDPMMKELIPYQGQPYITITGMQRIAERNPMFEGYADDIVWGDRLKRLQQYPNEVVWECIVYRRDRRLPVRAYGRAGGAYDDRQPVAKQRMHEMAQKRAIHRALRAAFPVPIPSFEERITPEQLRAIHVYDREAGVADEERHALLSDMFGVEQSNELTKDQASVYLDGRVGAGEVVEANGRQVDLETGEILPDLDDAAEDLTAQLARDMANVKQWAADAQTERDLKAAYKRAVGLFGPSDDEIDQVYAERQAEIRAASPANGGGR